MTRFQIAGDSAPMNFERSPEEILDTCLKSAPETMAAGDAKTPLTAGSSLTGALIEFIKSFGLGTQK